MENKYSYTIVIVNTLFIILLLWIWVFLYYFYTHLNITKCGDWKIFQNNICIEETIACNIENGIGKQIREWDKYSVCYVASCNEWFDLDIENNVCLSSIRERTILYTGSVIANEHKIKEYPSIFINKPIEWWSIAVTIDFQPQYKEGKYDGYLYGENPNWNITDPQNFALFFFFGKEWQWSLSPYAFGYGWFFDVLATTKNWQFVNNNTLWLEWLIPWNQIVWWYARKIPIKDWVIFATNSDERTENYQYKRLNILDFILHIHWWLKKK